MSFWVLPYPYPVGIMPSVAFALMHHHNAAYASNTDPWLGSGLLHGPSHRRILLLNSSGAGPVGARPVSRGGKDHGERHNPAMASFG